MNDPTLEMWRLPKVVQVTGQSRETIRRGVNAGTFPQRYQLGAQAVAWKSTEVLAWMDALPPIEKK